ncbi:MAG: hypothetical protein R3E41_02185 [Burkholderiaceae bacterium]
MLSVIGSARPSAGLFVFRRFMAERSIYYIVGMLTVVGMLLILPIVRTFTTVPHLDGRALRLVGHRYRASGSAVSPPLDDRGGAMLAWIASSAPETEGNLLPR